MGEVHAFLFGHDLLEGDDEAFEIFGGEFGVALDAAFCFQGVEGIGEEVAVDVEDGLAEHLDEAAVGVPGEALVAGDFREAEDRLVVETDVEDCFHHAGHGEFRAGADGNEERVVGVSERAFHLVFDPAQCGGDLGGEGFRDE